MSNSMYTVKDIAGSVRQTCPAVAIPAQYMEQGQDIHNSARGVTELYLYVSSSDFERLSEGEAMGIDEQIENQLEYADSNDLVVALIDHSGAQLIDRQGAARLINRLSQQVDLISTPLTSKRLDNAALDEEPGVYGRYLENLSIFVDAAADAQFDVAVLGAIPVLEWTRSEKVLEHIQSEIEDRDTVRLAGVAVDFLSKSPAAKTRVRNWIKPFFIRIGRDGLHENHLLYAVNAHRGKNPSDDGPWAPAENFLALGMGFDVLGSLHYQSRSGFSDTTSGPDFRWFDRERWEQRKVSESLLQQMLTSATTGLDPDDILEKVASRSFGEIQRVLEAEQMAIAAGDLRENIQAGEDFEFVKKRPATTDKILDAFETAATAYDQGRGASTLWD